MDKGSGSKPVKVICDPCSLDGQTIDAEGYCQDCQHFLCKECCAYHRKPIPSRHHNVVNNLASLSIKSRSNVPGSPGNVTEICDKHRPEAIKFHCESHDVFGCGTCMMLNHRDCKTVYIPDVASNPDIEKEHRQFESELENLEIEFGDTLNQADVNILEAKRLYVEMTSGFSKFKTRIIDLLDVIEKDFDEKATKMRTRDVKAMEMIASKCTQSKQEVVKLNEKTKHVTGRNDVTGLFIHVKRTTNEITALRAELDRIKSELWLQRYEFQPAIDLDVEGSLGNLVVFESDSEDGDSDDTTESESTEEDDKYMEDPLSPYLSVPELDKLEVHDDHGTSNGSNQEAKSLNLTYTRDLVTKASADFEHVEITGLALLPDNKLVIVDKGNQNAKLIDTKKNKVLSEIKVRYMIYNLWEPFGITAVDGNQVAVTCPFRQRIQIIKVKKSLSEGSALKVNGRCYGIAYDGSQRMFFVSFAEPAKIEMIDRTGNTIRALVSTPEAQQLFIHPSYAVLTNDGKNLYISDSGKSTVTRFKFAGDVTSVSVYKPISAFDPLGLAADKKGRVFVCDMSHDCVHCLTEGCALVQIAAEGENRFPTCITYNEQDDSFYMATGLERVVVFQLT